MPRGGPRPNSGGARPGAGRKPKPVVQTAETDARAFLTLVMQGEIVPSVAQLDAAKALVRAAAAGVKGERQKEAERAAAGGKFKPRPAPLKLVASG